MANTPRPNHAKRPRRKRLLGNPLIPLFDAYRGNGLPPVHIGWYNRRSGDILTTTHAISQEKIEGKTNKQHVTRVWAVENLGFRTDIPGPNGANHVDQRRQLRDIRRWFRQQNPTRVLHLGRVTVPAPPLTDENPSARLVSE